MLDCTPSNLRYEIEDAIRLRRAHTDLSNDLIRRFPGSYYRSDWKQEQELSHENHGFEWVSNVVPNLVFTNPKILVKHAAATDDDPQISAMRDGMNAWVDAINIVAPLEEIATDMQFDFGVGLVTVEQMPDAEPGKMFPSDILAVVGTPLPSVRPNVIRISPRRFFMDAQATSPKNARFMGHIWIEDMQDLLDAKDANGKPKYNAEAVKACGFDTELDELFREQNRALHDRRTRQQVVGYEVYVPEKGEIYTMGIYASGTGKDDVHGAFLRPPRKYVGPATGPYVLFGVYIVPDQLYPLPPLAVSAMLEDEINAHSAQASEDAAVAKQLIVTDGADVTKAITTAENGSVITVPNFTGRHALVRIGGANPENLAYIQTLRARLDRRSGITDAVAGNVTGATAEEVHTAQANRNVRIKFLQKKFREGVIALLRIAASQFWHNPAVRFPVKVTDPQTGQQSVGEFVGGQTDENGLVFNGLQIDIEPYSMEYVDEVTVQRNMMQFGALVANSLPVFLQNPWFKAREWLNDQGEPMNIRGGGDRYIDWDMLKQAQMMMNPMLFGIAPPGQEPGVPGAPPGPTPGGPIGPTTNAQASAADRRATLRLAQ